MNKIRVSKARLLTKLKENRDIHIKEYEEVYDEYQVDVIAKMKKLLSAAKKVNRLKEIDTRVGLNPPRSNETDYNMAIKMLEFSIDDELEITQNEFEQYVLNEWDWTRQFANSKLTYLKGL